MAKHLSGCLNTQADELSRLTDKYEWTLAEPMFHYLDRLWGPHTVDRFASALTTRLPKYNTRFLDPNGMPTDALAQTDWHHENNYVNAPFRLIKDVLTTVKNQRAHATIVAPWWPAQP